ncbi:hypothetical protein NQ117_05475 [Paenibacillus sp. SC116]|uniref:hypothetical protein n=1 Tax=Paenibacillus sp. SC116 TaxID=2968986 RepID=UPI00215B6432|nr:hypothetical protein [Paenibacillus sp. SC116]MCR8843123.1 hypothetical protein [Paenibacillus sp. SC116]
MEKFANRFIPFASGWCGASAFYFFLNGEVLWGLLMAVLTITNGIFTALIVD